MCVPPQGGRKEDVIMEKKINATEKFCTKCGHKFLAVGREMICPACKQAAAEAAKRAAVLKAKRASWNGESVPVRISGRASTIIREYGAANNMPFAAALDDLLKASAFFQSTGKAWEDVKPYKSHRRDKHTTETEDAQEAKTAQDDEQAAGKPQEVTKAARVNKTTTSKTITSKVVGKAASKAGKGGKA